MAWAGNETVDVVEQLENASSPMNLSDAGNDNVWSYVQSLNAIAPICLMFGPNPTDARF